MSASVVASYNAVNGSYKLKSKSLTEAVYGGNPHFSLTDSSAPMAGEISESEVNEKSQRLTPQTAATLLDSVELFLFDCDGVIWKRNDLIDGVAETLDVLRSMRKKFDFVTNNSTKSRRYYAKKFHSLGISVSEDEIFPSSYAAAVYLKLNDFPIEKKVYVIGGEGIMEELELAGFTPFGGPEDGMKTDHLKHDESVGAVVVGLDRCINSYKLQYASLCIRENPGCLFIATSKDAVVPHIELQEWPGCIVGAISGTTQKDPTVVGKPSKFMMDILLEKYSIPTSKMCMVGDRLETDILFGENAGCRTLLVLSGVAKQSDFQHSSNQIQPEYFTTKLSDILTLINGIKSPS